jgi:hypothetical protein
METKIIPRVGDFVVAKTAYDYSMRKISAVTAKVANYSKYGNRVGNIRLDDVVFAGTEAAAKRLHDQLTSSAALYMDDTSKASIRKTKRNAEYIAAAQAAMTPDQSQSLAAE